MDLKTQFQSKNFIFICGLHRSGTTILASELANHPEISGLEQTNVRKDEGQFLQNVYAEASRYGGPGKFGMAEESHLTENSELATNANALKIFEAWAPFWDLNKKYLLEKSPPNLIKTRFLQKLFPDSIFITILRHPIAVSLATQKWSKNSMEDLLKHWLRCHSLYNQDKAFLSNTYEVKYNELIKNPKLHFNSIYKLSGVNSVQDNETELKNKNSRYFEKWKEMQKGFFAKRKFSKLKLKYEDQINEFGFSLVV